MSDDVRTERFHVPDYTGLQWEAARQAIRDAGYRVQVYPISVYDPELHDLVVEQDPLPGTTVLTEHISEFRVTIHVGVDISSATPTEGLKAVIVVPDLAGLEFNAALNTLSLIHI